MAKPKKDDEYHSHWFTESLFSKKPSLPRRTRQKKSLPGQMSLPGMEGEAERNLPRKERT